jgi:hypothetical protein
VEKITDNKLRGWINNPPPNDTEYRVGDGFTVNGGENLYQCGGVKVSHSGAA